MPGLDQFLYGIVHAFAGRSMLADSAAVFLAEYLIYFLLLGLAVFVFSIGDWRLRWRAALEMLLAALLSRGIVTEAFRYFFIQERPFDLYGTEALIHQTGSSFPSGHTSFLFAVAGVLFLYNRKWGAWYLILAALIGLARIFVGVHWPFDILGGIIVGLASAWAIRRLLGTPPSPAGGRVSSQAG